MDNASTSLCDRGCRNGLEPGAAAAHRAVRLADGRRVDIRPVRPEDLDALGAFFAALSPATRRQRFHVSISRVPEQFLRAFTRVDQRDHAAVVAQIPGASTDRPGALVAEARYIRHHDSDRAELALVVAETWRRVGLGTFLARTLIARARRAGVRSLYGDALLDNQEVLGFLRSLGARQLPAVPGAGTVRLSLNV